MGRVHDGPGKRVEPVVGRLLDGPAGPTADHRCAWSAISHLMAARAVRASHVGPVHGPADGRPGQGHVLHRCPGVSG